MNGECSIVRKVAEAQRQCLGAQVMLLAVVATIVTENNAKYRGWSMWHVGELHQSDGLRVCDGRFLFLAGFRSKADQI